jgi:hypothetical protein
MSNQNNQTNNPSEKDLNQTNINEIEDGEIPNDLINSSNKVIISLLIYYHV